MCQSGDGNQDMIECHKVRVHKDEQDKVQSLWGNIQEGQRLMTIKLEKYSEVGELLIGDDTTGSLAPVIYQDTVWHIISAQNYFQLLTLC